MWQMGESTGNVNKAEYSCGGVRYSNGKFPGRLFRSPHYETMLGYSTLGFSLFSHPCASLSVCDRCDLLRFPA